MPKQNMDEFDNPVSQAARYQAEQAEQETAESAEPKSIPPFRPDDIAARADAAVDLAVARGDFDNLAYAGKPLPQMGATLDPDWWVQGLIQRENLTGLGPPAIMLRAEDRGLDVELDKLPSESRVREAVEDFNSRVIEARRQLLGGPPVVTKVREVENEVRRWRERRTAAATIQAPAPSSKSAENRPRRWFGLFRR